MSFDLMRRHRRKVEIPLAIFVVITFVLFFGISGIDKVFAERQRYGAADTTEEQGRLLVLGRDLARIGMLREPPKEFWDYDDKDAEKRARSLQVRADYANAVRQLYDAPVKMAGELGIRVSDEDLARELKQRLSRQWNLTQKASETAEQYLQRYEKLLKGRDLTKQRFEELVRGQMTIERLDRMMSAAGAASEAEMYRFYADANQKVRVQYFQRRTADFVKVVEEASRLEAAGAAKPADPAGKEGAKAGDAEKAEKAEKKDGAADKSESNGVSEADVLKRFEDEKLQLKSATPRPGESWAPRAVSWRPEYFSKDRARVEYLVALREKFARDVEVKPEDIEKYYKDNEYRYREEPKADDKAGDDAKKDEGKDAKAGEEPKPKIKPLDDKLKAEIRKTLVERKAIEKAEAALRAAVKEYNDADPEKRPALGALVARHHLETLGTSALAESEDLEALPQLKGAPWLVSQVFGESSRQKLDGKFTETVRTRADDKDEVASAAVALRVAEFQPGKLLEFEDVKATVRERLVIEKALKLAKEAAEADRKLLVEGKLDSKLVRLSEVLDSRSETAARTAGLAMGEASEPFAYRELLGEEAAAEKKKEEQKEKEKAKDKEGTRKKTEKPDLADDYSRGYRVAILAERVLPTIDEFRKDSEWKNRWSPETSPRFEGLPPEYRDYIMSQMMRQSPNLQWRSFYASEWVRSRCEKAMISDR